MKEIFVFGSNRAGRHGMGAALFARKYHGAVYGIGEGLTGTAYAIPTKDEDLNTLPLSEIEKHIVIFIKYARSNLKMLFMLTPIGTGLAGYSKSEIASILKKYELPNNIVLTTSWLD